MDSWETWGNVPYDESAPVEIKALEFDLQWAESVVAGKRRHGVTAPVIIFVPATAFELEYGWERRENGEMQ